MSIELVLLPIGIAAYSAAKVYFTNDNQHYRLPTVMKQEVLLKQAIENYGCHTVDTDDEVSTSIADIQINFVQTENGIYEAIFTNDVEVEHAQNFLDHIHQEYKYLIQQKTYEQLLERSKNVGLELENEQRLADQTIVLTFNVNR